MLHEWLLSLWVRLALANRTSQRPLTAYAHQGTPIGASGRAARRSRLPPRACFCALTRCARRTGELWNLEGLSELCKKHKRYSFFLTSAPLHGACLQHTTCAALAHLEPCRSRSARRRGLAAQRHRRLLSGGGLSDRAESNAHELFFSLRVPIKSRSTSSLR
jgi:hypothetical protein